VIHYFLPMLSLVFTLDTVVITNARDLATTNPLFVCIDTVLTTTDA